MYLQGIVRLVFVCFLAIDIRTVQADEPLVSFARDDADMMFSRGDRRRWGWWKKVKRRVRKVFKKVKHYYYKTHPAKLRACKKDCVKRSLFCGKLYGKCLAGCTVKCYATSKYRTYFWKWIRG